VLSVDPGIYSLGAVLWDLKFWYKELKLPIAGFWYEMKLSQRKCYISHQVSYEIVAQLFQCLTKWNVLVHLTVCEKPQSFGNKTIRSVIEMEFQRGLIYAGVGSNSHWQDINVSQWKGNMPKELVVQKLIAKYGLHDMDITKKMSNPPSHDWDALGIGLFAQGMF